MGLGLMGINLQTIQENRERAERKSCEATKRFLERKEEEKKAKAKAEKKRKDRFAYLDARRKERAAMSEDELKRLDTLNYELAVLKTKLYQRKYQKLYRHKTLSTKCWECIHAVPDRKWHGCEWSKDFKPVPGWHTIATRIKAGAEMNPLLDSFLVLDCPKFRRDPSPSDESKPAAYGPAKLPKPEKEPRQTTYVGRHSSKGHVCKMRNCIYSGKLTGSMYESDTTYNNCCNYATITGECRTTGGKHKIIDGKCDLYKRGRRKISGRRKTTGLHLPGGRKTERKDG